MNFENSPGKQRLEQFDSTKIKQRYVSIVTPYYNASKYIMETANSVLNQTFPFFEWIIVNDGSTSEHELKVLEKIENMDDRIKIYHQENGGASKARNYGISKSQTEYIVFLDADDLIDPLYLEYTFLGIYTNQEASWTFTNSIGFDKQEYLWEPEFSTTRMKEENILSYIGCVRKTVFQDKNMYDDDNKNLWEDYQFWLKVLAKGHRPIQIKKPFFWYRRLDSGELSKIEKNLELKKELTKRIKALAMSVPDNVSAIDFLLRPELEFTEPVKWEISQKFPLIKKEKYVLLMIPHLEMGGADIFNLDLVKTLVNNGYKVALITTEKSENLLESRFKEITTEIYTLSSFLNVNHYISFIHYLIVTRDIKVVFNISSFYGYYALPWIRKEFSDIYIYDYIHADSKYWRNGGYARLSSVFDSVIDKTWIANRTTLEIMEEDYNKRNNNTQVCYIGTDTEYFNPHLGDEKKIREKYKIPNGNKVVLFLCRINPEKRPFLMFDIAEKLLAQHKDMFFLIVGDGENYDLLHDKIKKSSFSNRFILTGEQKNTRDFYAISDVLLITSLKEGLTLTAFEAMSMGLPVISSDVGGQKELINSERGELIPCLQDEAKDLFNYDYSAEEINLYVIAINRILYNSAIDKNGLRDLIIKNYDKYIGLNSICSEVNAVYDKMVEHSNKFVGDSRIIDELVTIFSAYQQKEEVANRLWLNKLRIEDILNNKELFAGNGSSAELRLQEIYSMRSWKMIEKYQRFMNNTAVGKVLSKIRDGLRGTK